MTPGSLLDGGQDLGTILGQCDHVKAEATKQWLPELLISGSKLRVLSGSPPTDSGQRAYTIAARGGRGQIPLRCPRDGTTRPSPVGTSRCDSPDDLRSRSSSRRRCSPRATPPRHRPPATRSPPATQRPPSGR